MKPPYSISIYYSIYSLKENYESQKKVSELRYESEGGGLFP